MTTLGFKFSKESRMKMSIAKLGIIGEKHASWKGDRALYGSKHDWIERHYGHAKKCKACGFSSENHRKVEWCNISLKYKRDRDDYVSLCRSCHRRWDYGILVLIINGIEYKRPLIFKGTGSTRHYRKWVAQCRLDGKQNYLGIFKSKNLADEACINFRKKFEPKIVEIK